MGLRTRVRHRPLLAFGAVAFGWTWGWDAIFFAFDLWNAIPVSLPRVWGPAVAAVVVLWAGETPFREWIRTRLARRVAPSLLLFALLVPLFISNVQPVVESVGSGTVSYDPPAAMYFLFAFIAVNMFLLGGTEELGWRGVVQPRLQRRLSVFAAGLVVGAVWWAWHLPLFFTENPSYSLEAVPLVSYTLFVLGSSVVLGAVVNLARGSVLPAMLMHASTNAGAFLAADGGILEGSPLVPILVGAGLWWAVAAGLIARYGTSMTPTTGIEPLDLRAADRTSD